MWGMRVDDLGKLKVAEEMRKLNMLTGTLTCVSMHFVWVIGTTDSHLFLLLVIREMVPFVEVNWIHKILRTVNFCLTTQKIGKSCFLWTSQILRQKVYNY